jgi:CubicO group peptidase (beta-lactamase class C family)
MLIGATHFCNLKLIICLLALHVFVISAGAQQLTRVEQVDKYIQEKIAKSNVPGLAIAIVHYDTVLMAKGYGVDANNKPLNANSPFAIASLSKAFTAAAVLQLAETGKLNIDSPVIKYIPSFLSSDPLGEKVTIRQLLHQIGGMADTGYPEFSLKRQPSDLDDLIKNLQTVKLTSRPGQAFHYHNPNYQVLAKIVESASKETFSDYLQKHLFGPLQMGHTSNVESVKQFFGEKGMLPKGSVYVLGKPLAMEEPDWFVNGDAGIVSTANDMGKWLSDQLKTGKDTSLILNQRFLAMMQNPPAKTNFTYAMGWHANVDAHVLYHSGIMWTYSSQQIILTDKGYGIVMLFNSGTDPIVDYYSLLQGVQNILVGEKADTGTFPPWLYTIGVVSSLIIVLVLGIRRMFRLKQWHHNYIKRAVWKRWLLLFLRIAPLLLLLVIPSLVTLLSGRVLSFQRITLMFIDVILVIGLLAFVNLLIVLLRLIYLGKQRGLR